MTSMPWLSSSWAIEAISNHLWQSTVVAGLVALATIAFRKNAASARHALWVVASVKFLVPSAALMAAGQLVGARSSAHMVRPEVTIAVETLSQPFTYFEFPSAARPFVSTPEGLAPLLPRIAATIWLAGVIIVLAA